MRKLSTWLKLFPTILWKLIQILNIVLQFAEVSTLQFDATQKYEEKSQEKKLISGGSGNANEACPKNKHEKSYQMSK